MNRFKPHTLTGEILLALSTARFGLSAMAIFDQCELSDDPDVFKTMLCMVVKNGLAYRDGRSQCGNCKTTHICYRITDKGRIRLLELTPEVA